MTEKVSRPWYVYILRCRDNSLYTGVTTDLARRLDEHNSGRKPGARYTRYRLPAVMVFGCECKDRSDACKKEVQIKKLPRSGKLELMSSAENQLTMLAPELLPGEMEL